MAQIDHYGFRAYLQVLCRHCHRRVNVSTRAVFRANYSLRGNTFGKFVVLNGMGLAFCSHWLFNLLDTIRVRVLDMRKVHQFFRAFGGTT